MRHLIATLVTLAMGSSAFAGDVVLTIDHPTFHRTETPIGSIVLGNPAIADISVKSNREIVLFAKMPGSTSLTLFDQAGEPMERLTLSVQNPRKGRLTLQAGGTRYTFACTPACEQINAIGDGSNESRMADGSVSDQAQEAANMAAQSSIGGSSNSSQVFAPALPPMETPGT